MCAVCALMPLCYMQIHEFRSGSVAVVVVANADVQNVPIDTYTTLLIIIFIGTNLCSA